jgi:hypothetical protein
LPNVEGRQLRKVAYLEKAPYGIVGYLEEQA